MRGIRSIIRERMPLLFLGMVVSCGAGISNSAYGDSFYPKSVPTRFFGMDQGRVGSCSAEAEVAALEHVFANLGFAVKLSTFYRHAKNWQRNSPQERAKVGLVLSAADVRILNAAGSIIPDYMWPEDGEGLNLYDVGAVRPSVSEQALIDPNFPTAESLGYRETFKNFEPGLRGGEGSRQLKADLKAGLAVTLTVPGAIFHDGGLFDHEIGFPYREYTADDVPKKFVWERSHQIAVVGFDDDLKSYIVRNSWNDPDEIRKTSGRTNKNRKLLEKMRFKISEDRNLPGYYALPYAYVNDLTAARYSVGYSAFSMNFKAYGEAYLKFEPKYKVAAVPFSCDMAKMRNDLKKYSALFQRAKDVKIEKKRGLVSRIIEFATGEKKEEEEALKIAMFKMVKSSALRDGSQTFSYAKLPANPDFAVDRVAEFYAGTFTKYYCGNHRDANEVRPMWPGDDFKTDPLLRRAVDRISADPTSIPAWKSWFDELAFKQFFGIVNY